MRGLKTWAWATVIAAAMASPAFAQQTGGTTGSTGSTSSTRSTGGITGGSALSGSSLGGSSLVGNNSNSSSQSSGITAPTGSSSSSLAKSNFLAGYYVNPYSMGMGSTTTGSSAGTFGTALYGTTGSTTGRGTGATGQRGSTSNQNQSGIVVPLPVQINYTAQMRFATPATPAPKLQADLRSVINASGISSPNGVQAIITDGTNVVLRGTVKDIEEARLTEGIVRLTPGVGFITNELTFPVASASK